MLTVAMSVPGIPLETAPANKRTVRRYMETFAESDHAGVLDCLTDGKIRRLTSYLQVLPS